MGVGDISSSAGGQFVPHSQQIFPPVNPPQFPNIPRNTLVADKKKERL
jgi:hypothetical protein